MKDSRRAFLRKLDETWPGMARAFVRAMQDVRNNIAMQALEDAIARQDIEAAFEALNLDRGLLAPVTASIVGAHQAGGEAMTESVVRATRRFPVGARVIAGFDVGNPRAAERARSQAARLVTEVTDDTRDLIRDAVEAGLEAGHNPRKVALEIAGRTQGSRRVGGMVGLHSRQAEYVRSARAELEALDGNYFTRTRRDRRFDASVARAIRTGQPLVAASVEKIAGRYADRLLKTRADTIARTEAQAALHGGRDEALKQLLDSGKVQADAVTYAWDATGDARTRPTHAAADGQTIKEGEAFDVGGHRLRFPGDTELGAPASETIGCRCFKAVQIDFMRGLQ